MGSRSLDEPVEAMAEPHPSVASECHRCLQRLTRFCARVWQLDLVRTGSAARARARGQSWCGRLVW